MTGYGQEPGFDVDVYVGSPLRAFIRVWSGDVEWADALAPDGGGDLHGPPELCRQLPSWFTLSHDVAVPPHGAG